MFRQGLSVLFVIIGILTGIYVGGYLMLYGGIIQIINSISPLIATDLAKGILKVLFCEFGFYIPFLIFSMIGAVIDE